MTELPEADLALLGQELPALQSADVVSPLYDGGHGRLEYRMAGATDRPVILLLHGLGSSSAGYRAQLAGLADDFRVIAWNAPGFGGSTHLATDDPDVHDYADIIAALLTALRIDRVAALVGSSWGSVIATAFAARQPERLGHLVLSAANTARGNLTSEARATELAARLQSADTSIPVPRSAVADRLLTPQTPPLVRQLVEPLRDAMTTRGWRQAITMLFTVYTPDLIREVASPISLLAGTADQLAPYRDHAVRLRDAARSAELHLFEGYGHMLKLEAPTRFNTLLRASR